MTSAMALDLTALHAHATREGWATGRGSLTEVRIAAAALGWVEVANRRRGATVDELRPTAKERAQPRSLSALYGLGQQPLHTDGAHLPAPPEIVVLASAAPTPTPTLVWKPSTLERQRLSDDLHHGMFRVDEGSSAFLASAALPDGLRYDPGCMQPCDQRSRRLATFFAAAITRTHEHSWAKPSSLLVIDNRATLHARAAVAPGDETRLVHRLAFSTGRGT